MAGIVQYPNLIFFSLLGLGSVFLMQFRLARGVLYFIFAFSLGIFIKLIVNHHFFSTQDYINLLWSCLLALGLFIAFYAFLHKRKNKKSWIVLWVAIICAIIFNCLTIWSLPNYTSEIASVSKETSFIASEDVIQLPLNRYLIIKSQSSDKFYLFKIEKFTPSFFTFSSTLLKKIADNKFEIVNASKGQISFSSFYAKGHDLFNEFEVIFLPVNSLIKLPAYSYGYLNDERYVSVKNIIELAEHDIIWLN